MNGTSNQRVLYLDCASGASGDMLLAALLALGDAHALCRTLTQALGLPPQALRVRRAAARALSGLQCRVASQRRERTLLPYLARLQHSRLPRRLRQRAQRIVRRLIQAEHHVHQGTAHAHRVHELGRLDTLIAIAGCVLAVERLRVRRVFVGPLPLGYGWMPSAGGALPNPGPAVLELLRGFPIYMTRLRHELVTPTAAAILSSLTRPLPSRQALVVERIGYGVGTRRMAGVPGVVRACLGRIASPVK